jgi:fluoroquinolone transport system permease protein
MSNVLELYRSLGPLDLRNVRRDPLLAWIAVLPFVLALVYRLFVPWLREALLPALAFDLTPYYPLIASSFITAAPGVVGMVVGFILIDERDDGVLTAVAVTPVTPATYIAYRISAPLFVGVLMTVLAYPIMRLAPLPISDLLAIAFVAAPLAPITALFLAVFAQNKVSGLAIVKILKTVNIGPVVAWFVPLPSQWLVGVVPAYWPMKMLWLTAEARAYVAYLVGGLLVSAAWILVLLRKFQRR